MCNKPKEKENRSMEKTMENETRDMIIGLGVLDDNNHTSTATVFDVAYVLMENENNDVTQIAHAIVKLLLELGHTATHYRFFTGKITDTSPIAINKDEIEKCKIELDIKNIRIMYICDTNTKTYCEFLYDVDDITSGINSNSCIRDKYYVFIEKNEHICGVPNLDSANGIFSKTGMEMKLVSSDKISSEELNSAYIYLNQTKDTKNKYTVHTEYEGLQEGVVEAELTKKEIMDLHKFFYNEKLMNFILPKNCNRIAIKQGSVVKTEYIRREKEDDNKSKEDRCNHSGWLKPDVRNINWNSLDMLNLKIPYVVPIDFKGTITCNDETTTYDYHNVLSIPSDVIELLKEAMCKEKEFELGNFGDCSVAELIDMGALQQFILGDPSISRALINFAYISINPNPSQNVCILSKNLDTVIYYLDNNEEIATEIQFDRVLPYDLIRTLLGIFVKASDSSATSLQIVTLNSEHEQIYGYNRDCNSITEEKTTRKTLSSGEILTATTNRHRSIKEEEYIEVKQAKVCSDHGVENRYYYVDNNPLNGKDESYYFYHTDMNNGKPYIKTKTAISVLEPIISNAGSLIQTINKNTDWFKNVIMDDINTKIKTESIDGINIVTRICIKAGKEKLIVITPCTLTIYPYQVNKKPHIYDTLSIYDAQYIIYEYINKLK